jgi:hypothetical protein
MNGEKEPEKPVAEVIELSKIREDKLRQQRLEFLEKVLEHARSLPW